MKCHSFNTFFETIAPRMRLRILEVLQKKPMSVSEICESLGEEQSKVSHNLKKLSECHFLDVEQAGKQRIYSLNKETMVPLMKLVEKHVARHCCNGCRMKHPIDIPGKK